MKPNYQIYSSIARPIYTQSVSIGKILRTVSQLTGIPVGKITSKGRKYEVVNAKHIARYMLYHYTHLGQLSVAKETGATNHTTTLNSLIDCEDYCQTDKEFRHRFETIKSIISVNYKRVPKYHAKRELIYE